ncbi:MAG: CHAT domain-containing protein [Panacibacter sp.]
MPTFKFYGIQTAILSDKYQQLRSVQPTAQVTEYTALSVRSGESNAVTINTSDDDVVIMQMSNDVEWHYRADDFEDFLKLQPGTKRSGVKNDELEVPSFLISQGDTRGPGDMLKTKALKVITGMVAKGAARLLAEKMERSLDTGLHACNDKFEFIDFDKSSFVAGKPYLLFIHGTNSSTDGAFKGLKTNGAYDTLFKFYNGRVLAFEHKTLSESPVKNVTDLLNKLPKDIILNVISHSRGGIIADLLARCSNAELPFSTAEMKRINSNEDLLDLKEEAETANKAASGKNVTVSKMVRVACPSAGTVLIANRLDNVVNVLSNLLKLIPGAAACMPFTLFLDFVQAVVHERTDIDVFPGLAAQIPGSPLLRVLNNPEREIKSELFVISGDVEHSGILKSMLVVATNLYFGEAHDYVVNSNSMFRGTYRSSLVKEHFEQEPGVNHFNYFINKKSQKALLAALTDPSQVDGLYEVLGESSQITIVHERGITGKKPAVYILPGIMGSTLDVGKENVWVNYLGLVGGKLSRLTIDNENVQPVSVHAQTYGSLINYLSSDFDVISVPYDWRLSLTKAADLLAAAIKKEMTNSARTCQEFHFIAHSMGGLVLRAMIQQHKDVWSNILKLKKPKVLMMGVPNEGSYGTIRILLGKDSVIKKLSFIDFAHSKKSLLNIFKEYPGLMQLLPCNANGIFDMGTWNKLGDSNDEFTGIPSQTVLGEAADFYKTIKDTDYDNEIFRYIAGKDDSTPDNYVIANNGKIIFSGTAQGDGRVLWSTIPSSLLSSNVYYVQADHGNIPKLESAFEGFKELLTKGSTVLLSNTQPLARGTELFQIMPDSDNVSMPSENEFNENILGSKESIRKTANKQIINVSVTNGDLVHSKYPVVVGHFTGDGIIYAEKYLDRALNSKLSEYHLVGNYPGDIGTHLVILNDNIGINENMTCKGGVVVGLGEFGSLTENRLLVSLTQAFLTLAIKYNEYSRNKNEDSNADFGVSALLVGSDFAGLRISTSVKTIFSAVLQVNEKLNSMHNFEYKKINCIEIVEIYKHKTIQVGRIIKNFLKEDGFSNFRFMPPVMKIGSGALKVIADENQQDNWHRLEVSIVKKEESSNTDKSLLPMHFASITDKAHADEELLPANRLIVESLIEKVAKHSQWNKIFSQTLYELLIPNNFKGYGSSLRNMVLIVDKQTARYPWELLHDANGISEKPMIINTGIVRQLKTDTYRKNVIINTGNRALVIGNPETDDKYPNLPAAAEEAANISNIFDANSLETIRSIGEQDIEIVQKLLTKSYKIIHIASHGIVSKTVDGPTGVVIGKEIVFTARDFEQIRVVPEFVFINCCSSNDYDPAIADEMRRKYDVAASVGTQLIEMGVRAAIVTGWEIDDSAAAIFSATFYNAMFEGKTFGDAVRAAREKTYNQFGQTNTWGAYQCYGDPFYTFMVKAGWTKKPKPSYVDPVEVIYDIDNLISEITSASKRKEIDEYKSIIGNIESALQPSWKINAEIIERFALLYQTLGMFDSAIAYYQQLFTIEEAAYTIRSLEQYNNIRVRHAVKQCKAEEITKTEAGKIINEANKDLEKLKGETFERYSLIAANYRRFFEIDTTEIKPLIKAAEFYRKAYEYSEKAFGNTHYYPYFNWLHFAILLSSHKAGNTFLEIPANVEDRNAKALTHAKELDNQTPDFYNKTAQSSFYISQLLSSKETTEFTKFAKQIETNFREAWAKEGRPNERNSFTSYLEFIVSLLEQLPTTNKKIRDEKTKALSNLIARIKK